MTLLLLRLGFLPSCVKLIGYLAAHRRKILHAQFLAFISPTLEQVRAVQMITGQPFGSGW